MKFNIHKLKKSFKHLFTVDAVVKYDPIEDELELIEYFSNAIPKDVLEAELPYMSIPFTNEEEPMYYLVSFDGDSFTGEVEIDSYHSLTNTELEEFTK